ncbi:MAG TPA: DUF305 domain-containing protein [Acidimicrobiia bacterium]|nr:DUF305 domain-containing protein [Acidimicrobiia bacterium]
MQPSRWQVVALVVALCLLSGAVGYLIGRPDDSQPFNKVDVGFLSDMQTHHGGAIALAFAYQPRQHDPLLSQISREIILDQAQQISQMNTYLDRFGNQPSADDNVAMDWMGLAVPKDQMPGMPTNADMQRLESSQGLAADDVFSELMIKHHAAGVAMSDYEVEHGDNPDAQRLAAAMARVQRSEIAEMNTRRRELGLQPIDATALEDLHAHAN